MDKRTIKLERVRKAILEVVASTPNGATREEIKARSGLDLPSRTLQRRLNELVGAGKLTTTGQAKATHYHLLLKEKAEKGPVQPTTTTPELSEKSQAILSLVRQRLETRRPVGYNRGFLDAYRPNQTFYLSASEREWLAQRGQTPTANQPAGTFARQILNRLLIDLSWNSSRLEGNTYSLLDTQLLLDKGAPATEKTAMETQMILNHKDAIEFIVQQADESIGFNRYTITNIHALLSGNLLPDPAASGRLRRYGVGIGQSVYTPLDTPQLIEELFELVLQKAAQIEEPFEQAFFAMVHLPYLQPFDDVNKRVSRLAANIPLNRHNLAPLSFTDVPQDLYVSGLLGVYELNEVALLKDVFIWAYERSAVRYATLRQTIGEPDPFRLRYRDTIRQLVADIIVEVLAPAAAAERIKTASIELPPADRTRFVEAVDTELMSLHEGNFARYRVTPSQFSRWKEVWH